MATKTKKKSSRSIEPIRLGVSAAAKRCDVSHTTIRKEIDANVFTVIAPRGRGHGKPIFLYADEVDAYAIGGVIAVIRLRRSEGRL